MSVINNNLLLTAPAAASATGVSRSLRFNAPDSAYLSRTPASAGNRKTWTWAGWVKNCSFTRTQFLFGASNTIAAINANGTATDCELYFNLRGGATNYFVSYANKFRDPSAWYHLVFALDTTQATASDRLKVYVNGVQITAAGGLGQSFPPQNSDLFINDATSHTIGGNYYFDGFLADCYLIDGLQLDPTSFTTTDATTGQLIPKAFSGSYGTNGFHLTFEDNSSNTATTLGKDSAGSNNWTPNNFSITAGAGNDSLIDVPTNGSQTDTGVGGEVRGNYATLNPLDKNASATLSNGNLDFYNSAASHYLVRSTFGIASGKWYWEATIPSDASSAANFCAGISRSTATLSSYVGADSNGWGLLGNGNTQNGSGSSYTTALALGDVIGIAFDADAGKIWWSKNGTYPNSGNPATGANAPYSNVTVGSGPYFPSVSAYQSAAISNFGQRAFAYTAPSGFKALCTTNLPAPLVTKPNTVMDVKLYSGTGSSQNITGLAFSPDFIWTKPRNEVSSHVLFDIVRGTNLALYSNATTAETTETTSLTAFNSDGFSLGANNNVNKSSISYAAWTWDAGSSTVTNTQGSITSSVRANPTAGFSVVTYTGTGSAATVGHGLGVAPSMVIVKKRSAAGSWEVYFKDLGASYYLELERTNAKGGPYSGLWNDTAPTSTVFSIGNDGGVNSSGATYVAYCWSPVSGYSSFGSYVGNGSDGNGPFVYTGFRPKWVMVKSSSSDPSGGGYWNILDATRSNYNTATNRLAANVSSAEDSGFSWMDLLSNGFKLRQLLDGSNVSGVTYIYIAFAESPFNYARAR